MGTYRMLIDGSALDGDDSVGVINPATAETFERAPLCSDEQLERAVEAAGRAFTAWSRNESRRREVLLACARVLEAACDELAYILTMEQGKPLADARAEICGAADWFAYTSKLQIPFELIRDDEDTRVEIRRAPLGIVAAIVPWNFPIMLAVWKIAPALLVGNTVVLKPSPFTPLSTLALGRCLAEIIPAGVVNIVSGGDELGARMIEHREIRKISFTGSISTGKKVAAAAAGDLKRTTLEMGGNDAAIILDDARPPQVAEAVFRAAFSNCGQSCCAIKRVYVHEDSHESLVRCLADIAKRVKVGDGLDEGTQIGPLNNRPQFDRIGELVADARRCGAKFSAGGEALERKGYFFAPTILTNVVEGVRIVDEEQFGPVLPVMSYRSVEEAVERANTTNFGLSASVWGSDTDRATEVAVGLQCGTVWVNQHAAVAPDLPFGGWKHSSIGVENGPWGLAGYTQLQTINVAKEKGHA